MPTNSAELLLIDIGNTNVKLRLAGEDGLLGRTRRLPTVDLLAKSASADLRKILDGWRYERAVLASVVPVATAALERLLDVPVLSVGVHQDIGVDLRGYPGRRTLGADRLADLAGAWALYGPGPLIVVDLGTAAVFNAIDARGAFLGGVIAPGIGAIHGSLPARAAQLPLVKLRKPRHAIGRTTREALLAGVVYGYQGMVREILATLRAELGDARVVATGGDVRLLHGQILTARDIIDPDLTMQGLRVIGALNQAKNPAGGKKALS
jgi:type III pantothenate kinase